MKVNIDMVALELLTWTRTFSNHPTERNPFMETIVSNTRLTLRWKFPELRENSPGYLIRTHVGCFGISRVRVM